MKLADLPSAVHPPAEYELNKEWQRAKRRSTRREFIRLVASAGVGTGLAFVSLMPTARPARATHLTDTDSVWQGEDGGEGDYCTDNGEWAGDTGCAQLPDRLVSSTNCGSDGWHRHHLLTGTGYAYYYKRHKRCGTSSVGTKQAWIWVRNGTWRCSDGQYKYCVNGYEDAPLCASWNLSVCPHCVEDC